LARWGAAGFAGAAAGIEEGVDELEDGALVGGERGDGLEAFQEPGGLGGEGVGDGGDA